MGRRCIVFCYVLSGSYHYSLANIDDSIIPLSIRSEWVRRLLLFAKDNYAINILKFIMIIVLFLIVLRYKQLGVFLPTFLCERRLDIDLCANIIFKFIIPIVRFLIMSGYRLGSRVLNFDHIVHKCRFTFIIFRDAHVLRECIIHRCFSFFTLFNIYSRILVTNILFFNYPLWFTFYYLERNKSTSVFLKPIFSYFIVCNVHIKYCSERDAERLLRVVGLLICYSLVAGPLWSALISCIAFRLDIVKLYLIIELLMLCISDVW